jgi:hypothetical protein
MVEPAAALDWLRIAELVARYGNLALEAVDASVIVSTERLGTNDIATLDRRHLAVVQSHIAILNLLPRTPPSNHSITFGLPPGRNRSVTALMWVIVSRGI